MYRPFPNWPSKIESGIQLLTRGPVNRFNQVVHGAWIPETEGNKQVRNINGTNIYTYPKNIDISKASITTPINAKDIAYKSKIAQTNGAVWEITGVSEGKYAYLFSLNSEIRKAGDIFIIRGTLKSGGLQLGLINSSGSWERFVVIKHKGDFLAMLQIARPGQYTPTIANYLKNDFVKNDITINQIGWGENH